MSSHPRCVGLNTNMVSARVAYEPSAQVRDLIWWLQSLTWSQGCIEQVAEAVAEMERGSVGSGSIAEWVHRAEWDKDELDSMFRNMYREADRAKEQEELLARRRLDPKRLVERIAEVCLTPAPDAPASLWNRLAELRAAACARARSCVAMTETVRAAWAALDRCAAMRQTRAPRTVAGYRSRRVFVIEGPSMMGKTAASKAWCAASGGIARYVATPHGNDTTSLLWAIAEAAGLNVGEKKALHVEERIMKSLPGSGLVLVFDDAWKLWPQGDTRQSHPKRLNWILSLIDAGVPVALVTSPQWWDNRRWYIAQTRWAVEQFDGRVADIIQLPRKHSLEECQAVAACMLPEAGEAAWEILGRAGCSSSRRLGALEAIVDEATYIAQMGGRTAPGMDDIKRAARIAIDADSRLAEETSPARTRRRVTPDSMPGAIDRTEPTAAPALGRANEGHSNPHRMGDEGALGTGVRRGVSASGEPEEAFALIGNGGSDIAPPERE